MEKFWTSVMMRRGDAYDVQTDEWLIREFACRVPANEWPYRHAIRLAVCLQCFRKSMDGRDTP